MKRRSMLRLSAAAVVRALSARSGMAGKLVGPGQAGPVAARPDSVARAVSDCTARTAPTRPGTP